MGTRLRRFSTSFKVILFLLVAIFAAYLYKTFTTGTKQRILADNDTVAIHPLKKHKRKHHPKKHTATDLQKSIADTVQIATAKVALPKPTPVKPIGAVKPVEIKPVVLVKPLPVKRQPDSIKTSNNFLYTTYVQPNVTGIVKLRAQDKFDSYFIADIPANSKVGVLAKGNTYYRISYNNNIGFVPKWALHIK